MRRLPRSVLGRPPAPTAAAPVDPESSQRAPASRLRTVCMHALHVSHLTPISMRVTCRRAWHTRDRREVRRRRRFRGWWGVPLRMHEGHIRWTVVCKCMDAHMHALTRAHCVLQPTATADCGLADRSDFVKPTHGMGDPCHYRWTFGACVRGRCSGWMYRVTVRGSSAAVGQDHVNGIAT